MFRSCKSLKPTWRSYQTSYIRYVIQPGKEFVVHSYCFGQWYNLKTPLLQDARVSISTWKRFWLHHRLAAISVFPEGALVIPLMWQKANGLNAVNLKTFLVLLPLLFFQRKTVPDPLLLWMLCYSICSYPFLLWKYHLDLAKGCLSFQREVFFVIWKMLCCMVNFSFLLIASVLSEWQ